MHVLYGLHQPDAGEIWIDGQRRVVHSPKDAIRAGIGMVFQHFTLIPSLTVAAIALAASITRILAPQVVGGSRPRAWRAISVGGRPQ